MPIILALRRWKQEELEFQSPQQHELLCKGGRDEGKRWGGVREMFMHVFSSPPSSKLRVEAPFLPTPVPPHEAAMMRGSLYRH